MKRRFLSLLVVVLMTLTLFIASVSAEVVGDFDEITLVWGIIPAPSSGDAESARRLIDLISEKTNGKIKVELFPSATLGGDTTMLEGLNSNTIDMANISPSIVATIAPEINAFPLPFMFDSFDAALSTMTDPIYTAKISETLEKYGLKYLGVSYIVPRTIAITREIRKPSDTKGEVIRVMDGSIFTDTYNAWGFNSTIISWGETYTAVQQGVADGIDCGNEPVMDMAFYEVSDYVIQTDAVYHAQMTLMPLDLWNSLKPDSQKAILESEEENLQWIYEFSKKHWEDDTAALQAEPYNMNLIFLTPEERAEWVEASKPIYDKYIPTIGDEFWNWYSSFVAEKNAAD